MGAERTLYMDELQATRTAHKRAKKVRAGINVTNLGTHIFTTEECIGQITALEMLTASKKSRKRVKQTPGGGAQGDFELEPFAMN